MIRLDSCHYIIIEFLNHRLRMDAVLRRWLVPFSGTNFYVSCFSLAVEARNKVVWIFSAHDDCPARKKKNGAYNVLFEQEKLNQAKSLEI